MKGVRNPFCVDGMTFQSIRMLNHDEIETNSPKCSDWGVIHKGEDFYRIEPGTCAEKHKNVIHILYTFKGEWYEAVICTKQLCKLDPTRSLVAKAWREVPYTNSSTGVTLHSIFNNGNRYVLSSELDQLIEYDDGEIGTLIPPPLYKALDCHLFEKTFGVPVDKTTRLVPFQKAIDYLCEK